MKKALLKIPPLFLLLLAVHVQTSAREPIHRKASVTTHLNNGTRAAACAPATGLRDMAWNNVRALVETGGSMWQNRSNSEARYEVPKDGGVSSMFSGALWMGGESIDGQIKIAAHDYRAGNDFWPGPLTSPGAEVDEGTCNAYDRFWVTSRQEAALHRAYHDCLNDPGCNTSEEFPSYSVPQSFLDWPAHGVGDQDYYLAPFYDYGGDGLDQGNGFYDPNEGDYPAYDLFNDLPCGVRTTETTVPLYGDFNMFWIFNDKGNIHTETGGTAIGMEVRAQAFAFSSNDELNNMTFYNYTLINQGSTELSKCYFSQWADPDIGNAFDDFVGCDVSRGLGYCYNGNSFDDANAGSLGYGNNPPAIGIDFFEGPFQEADGIDNPLTLDYQEAIAELGIPYDGLGIGYGDSIVDNERFGMRKFLFYTNGQDPETFGEYWNYMQGIWPDWGTMNYGNDGILSGNEVEQPADFMYPNDTDEIGWGTGGIPQEPWREVEPFGDRRFIQSAGPFRLKPGARNNITVGVVWARGEDGTTEGTLDALFAADDKAQTLFNNCFRVLEGPHAPDVDVVELDKEIILNLSNDFGNNNNQGENYREIDASIPETLGDSIVFTEEERSYTFQGYQIYQLIGPEVSAADLFNPDLARPVAISDVKDGITRIINFDRDITLDMPVPKLRAEGEDSGIQHSFQFTHDVFAQGDSRLVNHRKYYYMAVAYAHNEYMEFTGDSGQDKPYLASRISTTGEIKVFCAIPHKISPESGGLQLSSNYGDRIPVTQLEGRGNGELTLDMEAESLSEIMSGPPWRVDAPAYTAEGSPITIKVIDPKMIQEQEFILNVNPNNLDWEDEASAIHWELLDAVSEELLYESSHDISGPYEEVLPDFGISVSIAQHFFSDSKGNFTPLLDATLKYAEDGYPWWAGVPDVDGLSELNWIRSGTQDAPETAAGAEAFQFDIWPPPEGSTNGTPFSDPDETYEGLLGGTSSPYCLTAFSGRIDERTFYNVAPRDSNLASTQHQQFGPRVRDLNNVNIVMTDNRELWTRCPVLEMQANPEKAQGGIRKMELRVHPSVDQWGKTVAEGANEQEATLGGTQPQGMGWFPGYAIDIGTGERLNMAFGEDSFMQSEHGDDLIWNPSRRLQNATGEVIAGGQHWIYIFQNDRHSNEGDTDWMPGYDEGYHMMDMLLNGSTFDRYRLWKSCTWVGSALDNSNFPLLSVQEGIIPVDCTIRLRVAQPYERMRADGGDVNDTGSALNAWNPRYYFSTRGMEALANQESVLHEALACINVVPNPYYAFSKYEANKLDNRVKITNLPEQCTVSIYSVSGAMIRQYKKSDPLTSLDWDLKNHTNVPIASGVYLIHVEVPGIGERILKWFGVVRPTDLENF